MTLNEWKKTPHYHSSVKYHLTLQNGLCVPYNMFLELLLIRDDYKGWFYGWLRGGSVTNSKQQNLDEILKQTNKQTNQVLSCVGIQTPCVWETACHTCLQCTHFSWYRTMITHKTPSPVNMINVNYAIFHTQTFSVDWKLRSHEQRYLLTLWKSSSEYLVSTCHWV